MIISASRRTDIPAYYPSEFFESLKQGFVDVRNPMNYYQVSKVSLNPEDVDCFVFWTKNPAPMLQRMRELDDYRYYFQFTITPYGKEIEPGIPEKEAVMETFLKLSEPLKNKQVIWRYDPILFSEKYDLDFHMRSFSQMAEMLHGSCEKVVFSFLSSYRKISANMDALGVREPIKTEKDALVKEMLRICQINYLTLESCTQDGLEELGVAKGHCIDTRLIRELGADVQDSRDGSQRPGCGCAKAKDIGSYGTCLSGCKYCYAS